MARIAKAWPQVASALLALLAFPPFNLGLLVFAALVPWFISVRKDTPKGAWKSGYGFGFIYGLGQVFWLEQLTATWTGSQLLAFFPYLVVALLYAIYFGLFAVLANRCFARGWIWMIPIAWAGIEAFRSYIPVISFPWGLLANPLWPYAPLIQGAHFGAIYFVSAWVVTMNLIVAMLMSGDGAKVRPLVTAWITVLAISFYQLGNHPDSDKLVVTIGQPGVDMAFGTEEAQQAGLKANVTDILTGAMLNGTQLAILPEGVSRQPGLAPPTAPFALPPPVPLIFGGQRGEGPIYQSAFAYDGKWQHEDKTRLVIFGEFVPGRSWLPLEAFKLPEGDLSAGTNGVQSLTVAGIKIGPILCFEGLFPDIAYRHAMQGSRLLAVMSIDDWYMTSNAPEQLRAAAVWRAVETGLPVARSASLGYTMAIDGKGNVLDQAPLRKPTGLRVEFEIPKTRQVVPWLPAFPLGAVFVGIFLIISPWIKPRNSAAPEPLEEK